MVSKKSRFAQEGPTPERHAKNDLERATLQWVQAHRAEGNPNPGLPYLVVGVLTRMYRRGDISETQKTAGERFAADFAIARLDPRHAPDLSRIPGQAGGEDGSIYQISAKMRIHDAIEVLGGLMTVGASACWHVLGCEDTIQKWAVQTGVNHRNFAGILIGALSLLERHYGLGTVLNRGGVS